MAVAAVILGALLTISGLAVLSPPAAMIAAGGGLILFGLFYETDRPAQK